MRALPLLWILFASTALAGDPTVFRSGFEAGEGTTPPTSKTTGIGTNLESVVDFAAAYPFADFFKQSRPWIAASQTVFDTERAAELDLDSDGWVQSLPACSADPNQFCIARTVLFSNPNTVYPSGQYVVRYEGQGSLVYRQNGQLLTPSSTPGQDLLTLAGNQIFQLDIVATAAAPNHLRNIRIFPPGIDPANPPTFHPDFLARLAPYRSLRFMDWMATNGDGFVFPFRPNTQQQFGDRARRNDAHWSREAGVPLEVMVELANLTGTEPWFTLPHRVDDDYVTQFAGVVMQNLDAGRRVYVEHSNEVWNNFPQGNEVQQRGTTLLGEVATPFERRLNAHGLRTRQICDLFRQVFATAADRIVCTLGSQAANAFTASEAADCPLARQANLIDGPCLGSGDALAIAPYFANYTNVSANEDEIAGWSLDQLFAEISSGGQLAQNVATPCTDNGNTFASRVESGRCQVPALEEIEAWLDANRGVVEARGMRMVAYEGGQHLVGVGGVEDNASITNLFVAANRDDRMEAIYVDYLGRWKAHGGELFVNFALTFPYGPSGSWGVLESLTQTPDPPKVRAIDMFNANNPCWWQGCGVEQPDPVPPTCSQPVLDPGFEATELNNSNPNWNSSSQQFGSALCDTAIALCADAGAPGTAVPRTGTAWTWFGVDAGAESASVSQTVTIPDDGPRHLNFFLRRGFVSAPFDATLAVRVGDQLLRTIVEPTSAELGYSAFSVDLSSLPRATPLTIAFLYSNGGDGKSNFNLDDVSLDCSASGN